MDGRDAPLAPVPADLREIELLTTALRIGEEIDDDIALVVSTSGTTGTPKGAMLTPAALIASASASHDRLGGPGTWLLALPAHHIAGVQVLVRSVLAGTVPVEMDVTAGFDVAELPTAIADWVGSGRRYASLVATQLAKALLDPPPRPRWPNWTRSCSAVVPRRGRCSRVQRPPGSGWCARTAPARPLRGLRLRRCTPGRRRGPTGRRPRAG